MDELRGKIIEQSTTAAVALSNVRTLKRILQRAGAKLGSVVASAEAVEVRSNSQKKQDREDMAERCATSLLERFKAMGSKVKGKSV